MDKRIFQNKVNEIFQKNPKIFALESDARADYKMIKDVEEYYNITLPEFYKDFLNQYGGGYFGFIIIYSCDCNGMFYIKDYVAREWVIKRFFLPIVDFETGDYLGVEIKEGICQSIISLYSHGENILHELEMDFYDALLKYGLHDDE